ncbi:MAG: hypothetical protein SXQ77_09055 [Halobacteria archaeon]|nr:hypothetical protein [Halobacteria archaeon]
MSTNMNLNINKERKKAQFGFAMTVMVFMSYLFFITQLLLGLIITMITRTVLLLQRKRIKSKSG